MSFTPSIVTVFLPSLIFLKNFESMANNGENTRIIHINFMVAYSKLKQKTEMTDSMYKNT